MKTNQLTRGEERRLMYVESKGGLIDGAPARIGWVTFSQSGRSVYYRGLVLTKARGISGNFIDESGAEFWVSGVKRKGSNSHPADRGVPLAIDDDALVEYSTMRSGGGA